MKYIVVNTYFRWNCGGNNVMLTGTFTGWKDHIPLQKVGQEFSTILVSIGIRFIRWSYNLTFRN